MKIPKRRLLGIKIEYKGEVVSYFTYLFFCRRTGQLGDVFQKGG